jgi:hypothetical protein
VEAALMPDLPSPSAKKSSKDKDKKDKKKKGEKKRKTSKRSSSKDSVGGPAYAPYLAVATDAYEYLYKQISGPKYDPYGPHPEEELAAYKAHMSRRGNCQLYVTFFLILMIPIYTLGSQALETGIACRGEQDHCYNKCVTDLQQQLSQAQTSEQQSAVSGKNELVIACREDCDAVYFECNRPTYLQFGGCAMLILSCPALMCLTNIFDTVREATKKEAEKLKREGLEKQEREATAPKKRERYLSKKQQQKEAQDSKDAPDLEGPAEESDGSPKRRTISGATSDLSDDGLTDIEEIPEARPEGRCVRVIKKVFKRCFAIAFAPVFFFKRKFERLAHLNKAPTEFEVTTDIQCPRCNSEITVQGLDRPNVQESLFSKQWGMNRTACYCPVCNEIISGICAF